MLNLFDFSPFGRRPSVQHLLFGCVFSICVVLDPETLVTLNLFQGQDDVTRQILKQVQDDVVRGRF